MSYPAAARWASTSAKRCPVASRTPSKPHTEPSRRRAEPEAARRASLRVPPKLTSPHVRTKTPRDGILAAKASALIGLKPVSKVLLLGAGQRLGRVKKRRFGRAPITSGLPHPVSTTPKRKPRPCCRPFCATSAPMIIASSTGCRLRLAPNPEINWKSLTIRTIKGLAHVSADTYLHVNRNADGVS